MITDRVRRLIVGILCLVLAVVAVWLNWLDPELGSRYPQFQAGALRMFPVLAVLWLAFPELNRAPGSIVILFVAIAAMALLFGRGKMGLKFLLPAISVLLVLGYLRRFTAKLTGGPRR